MENEDLGLGIMKQQESIKVVKNTRGYGWEIKLLSEKFEGKEVMRFQFFDSMLKEMFEKNNKGVKEDGDKERKD